MSTGGRPPRLLTRTMAATLAAVTMLLVVVFVVVALTVRNQVRDAAAANLEASQRMFAALETRRQHELQAQAATAADSPTLVAAIDTLQTEGRLRSEPNPELLETVDRELRRVAARVEADAIVLTDARGATVAAAGRLADRWERGRRFAFDDGRAEAFDGTVRVGDAVFRMVAVPLQLPDATVGTLYLATVLDRRFAEELGRLAGTRTAIVTNGTVLASTLPDRSVRDFEAAVGGGRQPGGTVLLDRESYAFRRIVSVGDTVVYALSSIDDTSRAAMRAAMTNLAWLGAAAMTLAVGGSFLLARLVTEPIGRLSASIAAMAASRDVATPLPLTRSSREIDALTVTFNALMASVVEAEEHTQAAYTGAIRALATALDARDPYTAGHSERVSVLSVAIGRIVGLSGEQLEVVRLGALLHDIGKIGIPDAILMKPSALTDAEFAAIKQHPVVGARILRSVPFLAPHIPIVELHHERPDGGGYPFGLRGDDTPLAARIVHVADAYDAMTSARAYRSGLRSSDALRELWRCAGTGFDADIVGALVTALPGVTSEPTEAALAHA